MTSVTLSVSEEVKTELKQFQWVNWSEVAREEITKKLIFENYIRTGTLTDKEWEFCKKIGWHPVDELPLKEEFRKELEKRKKEKSIRVKSVSDIFKNIK
ncbi:MAG TPA: hypothetical protein HA224_01410 [Nanoarchaeota archaeon]|nr:hypothetical protein [Nanoarchaeota archaeon]